MFNKWTSHASCQHLMLTFSLEDPRLQIPLPIHLYSYSMSCLFFSNRYQDSSIEEIDVLYSFLFDYLYILTIMLSSVHFAVCEADVDIGFLIDGSGSIRDANPADRSFDNWNLLLQFVANVIDRLPRSGTRVGAVLFSDRGELLFRLNQYSDLADARDAILRTRYPGANTNTSGGLYVARSQLFNVNNGDRPNVPNLLIAITDGKSTFDSERTIPIAEDLRRDGVQIVAVGITNSVDENELRGISSRPQLRDRDYFTSPDFQQLENIIESLLSSACVVTTLPPPTRPSELSFFHNTID